MQEFGQQSYRTGKKPERPWTRLEVTCQLLILSRLNSIGRALKAFSVISISILNANCSTVERSSSSKVLPKRKSQQISLWFRGDSVPKDIASCVKCSPNKSKADKPSRQGNTLSHSSASSSTSSSGYTSLGSSSSAMGSSSSLSSAPGPKFVLPQRRCNASSRPCSRMVKGTSEVGSSSKMSAAVATVSGSIGVEPEGAAAGLPNDPCCSPS